MEIKTEKVRLSKVLPNEGNPRQDFGDLDALADSIKATGGEPVNPIVCVRDANALFIVDGERRYRAMRKLYGDEDPEITVAVLPNRGDAAEIIAMLATDDKKRLTEAEKARGYQLAFDLGVDYVNDTELAMATGRKTDDVMNARLVWRDLGKAEREKYHQCTLDQLAAAQEFTGKDREAILKCKPDQVAMKVLNLREKIKDAALYDRIADICATVGLELIEHKDYGQYEPDEGMGVLVSWHSLDDDDAIKAFEDSAREMGATACVHATHCWQFVWALVGPVETEEDEGPDEDKLERDRAIAALSALRKRLCEFADLTDVPAMAREYGLARSNGWQADQIVANMAAHGIDEAQARARIAAPASFFELRIALDRLGAGLYSSGWVAWALPAAQEDGFEPDEDETWLLGYLAENEA